MRKLFLFILIIPSLSFGQVYVLSSLDTTGGIGWKTWAQMRTYANLISNADTTNKILSKYKSDSIHAALTTLINGKAASNHNHAYNTLTGLPTLFDGAYSSLTGKPTLFTQSNADALYSVLAHTHTFASNTSKPTTLSGYGITDGVSNTVTVNGAALSGNITVTANPTILAQINATGQTANIATATLYAVPSNGFYRVSIYITVTGIGTTSTMPSTTITYTDGNSGTNVHSTVTTATSTGNSVTTTFAQTTYVCYAKAGTNIQYASGSYASTGTPMTYSLRIRVESL